jgi:hypothetical protein
MQVVTGPYPSELCAEAVEDPGLLVAPVMVLLIHFYGVKKVQPQLCSLSLIGRMGKLRGPTFIDAMLRLPLNRRQPAPWPIGSNIVT